MGIECEDVLAQLRRKVGKIVLLEIVEQLGVSRIGERILRGSGLAPGVAIGIGKIELTAFYLVKQSMVIVHGFIHALDVHVFGLGIRNLEIESGGCASLGNDSQKKREYPGSESWPAISLPPLFLVIRARDAVQEFFLVEVRGLAHKVRPSVQQRGASHGGNEL